ncbi:MAG: methylmalonyl-CoA epimerase [Gemmatimonadota bacterium]|nr:methylmalonyl-CoA epimerase [Gemmatimonadota bacterium]
MSKSGAEGAQSGRAPRIAHVGIAVESLAAIVPFFRDVLGMPEVLMGDSDGAQIRAVASGESLLEFLEPVAPDTPIGKYLARRGPGIHHICIAVDDLDAALARCVAAGVDPIDTTPRMGAEGRRIAFLHPRFTGGILVELSE